ncbi:MAG: heme lyase CcmF/NrfE family subunit [Thermoleophilaceae bacterium]
MAAVGSASLLVGLLTAVYATIAALYGARSGRREFVVSARRAVYSLAVLLALAMVLLEIAYVRSDFSFKLVQQNSSTDTPTFYRLTAMWSSQEGSLLLWAFLLSVYSSAVLFATRHRHREIVPYATAVLGAIATFFLGLMLIYGESPFATLASVPVEGNGLNPLLRHPEMMIHPPILYSGYVGFSIPFAFAVGALITRRTNADWIRSTRRYALIAWTFLGCGVLLGALWSYSVLGWGGYWAWDPVENAALMPWLTGAAFLHSIMVQEKRGMLKVWNVSLIAASFVLSLLGTFLVRSGVLESIHAFGASTLGAPFLTFIGLVAAGSVVLIAVRLDTLRSESKFDSLLSRESFFLLNNLVLVALCVVIFWGTYFPLISELLTGTKRSVGPPFFDRVTMPLALMLVLLAGIGPVISWRRATPSKLRRLFLTPAAVAAAALLVLLVATTTSSDIPSLVMFTLAAFVLAVVGQEFWRGARARRAMTGERWPVALGRLVGRNRRRYGGYLVHAGIALVFVGVAGSSAFAKQKDVRMSVGQSTRIGGYTVRYVRPTSTVLDDRAHTGAPVTLGAIVEMSRGSEHWTFHPARDYYPAADGTGGPIGRYFGGESTSVIDDRWGLDRNRWMAIQPDTRSLSAPIAVANQRFGSASPLDKAIVVAAIASHYRSAPPPATFRVIISPMVAWIWIGGVIVLLGALTSILPRRRRDRRERAAVAARPAAGYRLPERLPPAREADRVAT